MAPWYVDAKSDMAPCPPLRAPKDNNRPIPGGCGLKERKLLLQSPSVTVSFSVLNNLKITPVIFLFILSTTVAVALTLNTSRGPTLFVTD